MYISFLLTICKYAYIGTNNCTGSCQTLMRQNLLISSTTRALQVIVPFGTCSDDCCCGMGAGDGIWFGTSRLEQALMCKGECRIVTTNVAVEPSATRIKIKSGNQRVKLH